jgi:hypothetical protein
MPGFLSAYEGTERIELGRGYWVDVKKCLSSAEYTPVEMALGSKQRPVANGKGQVTFGEINQHEAQIRMLLASIDDWNINDGDEGTKWPLAPEAAKRASIERLPAGVRMQVYQKCDGLNGPPDEAEQVRFPEQAVGGDPDGVDAARGTAGVPVRAGDVAEVRGDEPGPGELAAP